MKSKLMIKSRKFYAIILAVLAAVFYAAGIPISKIILKDSDPTMTAAFLYLGAGAGIGLVYLFCRGAEEKAEPEKFDMSDLPYLAGMIILDILAPIFLMNGIVRTAAANVSLLNNFEIVATSLIAYFVFKEEISVRMWVSLLMVTASSMILSFEGAGAFSFSHGSLFVLAASVCWGFENNCTRMISSKSTYQIVILKGLCSGSGSLIIALMIGEHFPGIAAIAETMALGFVAYGMSIFAYIRAQRVIGAAKTSAFYALAPFIGAFLSFILLHEGLSCQYGIALMIMIAGSLLAAADTLTYRHYHMHSHTVYHLNHGTLRRETVVHEHEHSHTGPGLTHHHVHTAVKEDK